MNRIQFWISIGLSGLVALLLLLQVVLSRSAAKESQDVAQAQQFLNNAQAFSGNLQKLAMRIVQVSQANGGDQGLKDLLTRNQITFTPSADGSNAAPVNPAPTTH